ncbi:MAG: hypothetical protein JWN07_1342 [Hyphomicrobiales bacterium]|nr:hypothetical protein [Hyphomicrobiales bacterium]
MISDPNANDTTSLQLRAPDRLVAESDNALQIKLVYVMVMLVIVVWVGVLAMLGRELLQRVIN